MSHFSSAALKKFQSRAPYRHVFSVCALVSAVGAVSVSAQERDPMLFHDAKGLKVRGHLQFGLNAVSEKTCFGTSQQRPRQGADLTRIPIGLKATSSPV